MEQESERMNCPFCNRDITPDVDVILSMYKKVIRYDDPDVTIYMFCPQCSRILADSRVELDRNKEIQTYREYRGKGKLEERYSENITEGVKE